MASEGDRLDCCTTGWRAAWASFEPDCMAAWEALHVPEAFQLLCTAASGRLDCCTTGWRGVWASFEPDSMRLCYVQLPVEFFFVLTIIKERKFGGLRALPMVKTIHKVQKIHIIRNHH
jgi:hypothetical protein